MKRLLSLLSLLIALLLTVPAWPADRGTPEEAKAMAIKAAAYLQSVGPEKAFAAFDAKDSVWHDRDLYVLVHDDNGVLVAHGTNPGLIGKSMLDLRDVDGNLFNRDIQAIKDAGWIKYKWQNPVTRNVEAKSTYWVHVGDYKVGVGAYAD